MKRGWGRNLSVAMSVLLTVAVAGCSSSPSAGPAPDAGLQRFYTQKLTWGPCASFATTPLDTQAYSDPKFDCAYLEVPMDYAQPAARTAQLAVLRQKASGAADQRIGSLLVNPGGPGASGTELATGLSKQISGGPLGQRFDLIGFDPRGVGASKPAIECYTPPQRDASRLDVELDNSPAGVTRQENIAKDYAAKCAERSGKDLLANAGTPAVAKDMDILRAALGDQKWTYLGYSYGTSIGTAYAEEFPANVRAMVLDGALNPEQSAVESSVAQSAGFQKAFDDFGAWCAKQPQCPLGTDPAHATAAFRALVNPLETKYLPVPDGRKLSYNDIMTGTIQALYSPQLWDPLRGGLLELTNGQGRIMMLLADIYQGRNRDGSYQFTLDAFNSISCVNQKPITDPATALERDRRAREVAPFEDDGHGPDPALDACAFWPVPFTSEAHVPQVPGLAPLLVISTTHDPATPYQAGVKLAKELNSRLLTAEGSQHTVSLQGNRCVDDIVTNYLVGVALPPEGTRCVIEAH